mmetsp:Transcript_11965/g.51343  ORF Transcript_11965/g.51343 Transcript_11965/m.51343 type:complete len:371 (+) Transcript_11965:120-1232(+)
MSARTRIELHSSSSSEEERTVTEQDPTVNLGERFRLLASYTQGRRFPGQLGVRSKQVNQQQKVHEVKSEVLSTTTNEDVPAFKSVNNIDAIGVYGTRDGKFERLLLEPVVNLQELQKLVWNGCPPGRRSICWKLLLGYLPQSSGRRVEVLSRKREEYHIWVQEHYDVDDIDKSEDELRILHQIKIDVPRTAALGFLPSKNDGFRKSIERILYVRSIRNPGTSYVQGMNDLVIPFMSVFLSDFCSEETDRLDKTASSCNELFDAEADCYWCLCKVLDYIQENYTFAQPGVQKTCFHFSELVKLLDGDLHQHLKQEGVDFLQFGFRWINCLLLREIPFALVPRLWVSFAFIWREKTIFRSLLFLSTDHENVL